MMYHYLLFSLMMLKTAFAEEFKPLEVLQFYRFLVTSGAGHVTYRSWWDEFGNRKIAELELAMYGRIRTYPVDTNERYFIAFKGDKLRWDLLQTRTQDGETYIRDLRGVIVGEESRAVDYSRKLGGIVQGRGYINAPLGSVNPVLPRLDIRPSSLSVGIGEPLVELLRGRSRRWGQLTVQDLGVETVDGLTCERIRLSNDRGTIDIWLSREQGYLPVRIWKEEKREKFLTRLHRYKYRYASRYTYRYKRYTNDIWFVDRVDCQLFWIDKEGKKLAGHHTIQVEDDFRINIDLPDDIFQIKFYKGQEVLDKRTGKVIRWGEQ